MEQNPYNSYLPAYDSRPTVPECNQNQSFNLLPVIYVPQSFIDNCRVPVDSEQNPKKPLNNYEKVIYDKLMHQMYGYTVRKPSYTDISQIPSQDQNRSFDKMNPNKRESRILLEASSFPGFQYDNQNDFKATENQKYFNMRNSSSANSKPGSLKSMATQSIHDKSTASQTLSNFCQEESIIHTKYPLYDDINESKFTQTDFLKYTKFKSTQTGVLFSKRPSNKSVRGISPSGNKKGAAPVEDCNLTPYTNENKCKGAKKKDNNSTIQEEILSLIQPKVPIKKKKKSEYEELQHLIALTNTLTADITGPPQKLKPRLRNKSPNKR